MKKLALYAMMFLGACLTACDEDFNKDVAAPQANEQEAVQSMDGFSVKKSDSFSTIVLDQAMLDANTPINVFTISAVPVLPEGATVSLSLEAAKTSLAPQTRAEDKIIALESHTEGDAVTIMPVALNEVVKELYGKAPREREIYIRAYVYIHNGTSTTMVPTPMQFGPVKVTPVAPIIESAYYVYGAPTAWSKTDVLKFSHSGKDVYEDPIFTIMFPAVMDKGDVTDCWFKIASQSSVDAEVAGKGFESVGILGCAVNGDESLEGSLVSVDPQAAKIAKGDYKYIRITLNMMESTYKIETLNISPFLWVPGAHNNWGDAFKQPGGLYSSKMDMKYAGFIYLDGEFKLTAQADWSPIEYNGNNLTKKSENILAGGGSNMQISEAGFYKLAIDINENSIVATKTEWGIIGEAIGGWGDADDVMMTYDKATNCWSVTTQLSAGAFKFRANHTWAVNVGGSLSKLIDNDSNNLVVAETGNYNVKLYLTNDNASYCTLTKVP